MPPRALPNIKSSLVSALQCSPGYQYTQTSYRPQSTSSINTDEITHFNTLAASWWEPHGPSRLLHLMNPLRHDFIRSCPSSSDADDSSGPKNYLDIGCGGGIFAESAARLKETQKVTAIDPSTQVIAVAKAHARKDPSLVNGCRLKYLNQSVEDLPLPKSSDEQFDIVSLFEVIEHIDKPSTFLEKCMPFVKPGGWLVGSTIARTWTSWLTTKVVAEDVVRMVPKGTHDWNKYINPEELEVFFARQEGWGVEGGFRSSGCIYIPGLGWKTVTGSQEWGNYFFGVRRNVMA